MRSSSRALACPASSHPPSGGSSRSGPTATCPPSSAMQSTSRSSASICTGPRKRRETRSCTGLRTSGHPHPRRRGMCSTKRDYEASCKAYYWTAQDRTVALLSAHLLGISPEPPNVHIRGEEMTHTHCSFGLSEVGVHKGLPLSLSLYSRTRPSMHEFIFLAKCMRSNEPLGESGARFSISCLGDTVDKSCGHSRRLPLP